jgi:uncharacterized protein (DUF433 family)
MDVERQIEALLCEYPTLDRLMAETLIKCDADRLAELVEKAKADELPAVLEDVECDK